jgi:GNAT superfamily N-acetyltransferase
MRFDVTEGAVMIDRLQRVLETASNEAEVHPEYEQNILAARLEAAVNDLQWITSFPINRQPCVIRPFDLSSDSIVELTKLLHRAYRKMADIGVRFVASWQDEARTLRRISHGRCLVAVYNSQLIGTVTLYSAAQTDGSPWYDRSDVGKIEMLAVDPDLQGFGLGSFLLGYCERMAAKMGLKELALDTSERAESLVEYYKQHGYRFIEYIQWPEVDYSSILLSKNLG